MFEDFRTTKMTRGFREDLRITVFESFGDAWIFWRAGLNVPTPRDKAI
jgi:hypothetical protein